MSKLPRHQLAAVLAEQSLGNINEQKFSAEVAAYLLTERRTSELDSLMRDIMQYRADHGIVEAICVSAFALTAPVKSEIESQIRELYPAASKVIITEEHDPRVMGGVRIELANQQLDLSVRAKLNRFKQLTTAGDANG